MGPTLFTKQRNSLPHFTTGVMEVCETLIPANPLCKTHREITSAGVKVKALLRFQ